MKLLAICAAALLLQLCLVSSSSAQTPAPPTPSTPKYPEGTQLEILAKKIDEQNAKIDTLSQQILKLQQEIAEKKPGVSIGENAPATPPVASAETAAHAAGGTEHTVARGETLTSIAKMYHVTIDELQRANHIDNPLKLQAGQTIMIPTAMTPTASPTSSPGQ
jgi:LysM repeat protein